MPQKIITMAKAGVFVYHLMCAKHRVLYYFILTTTLWVGPIFLILQMKTLRIKEVE